ncbi:IS3 family transposase [Streptomyces yanii]|uniref:IS3 family transposase n=1 Tax=Streptomyces yanii TaxID=78510 RepID=UPI003CD060ED
MRDAHLTEEIRVIHAADYGVYGARKIHAALRRAGRQVARCTVERLMHTAGLRGVSRAKGPRTTRPAPETARPKGLVNRKFTATAPNQLWVADITYIRTFSVPSRITYAFFRTVVMACSSVGARAASRSTASRM